MKHHEIVNKVKSILNEHGEVDVLSIGDDRVQLENYIAVAIPDAVVMLASKGYAVNKADFNGVNSEGISVPKDFISLIAVRLEGWKKTVTQLTEVGSVEYVMAMNEYTKPGVNTPVCYKENDVIICLPYKEDSSLGVSLYNAKYNPYKKNEETGEMVVDESYELNAEPKEATAVCYMAAALVLGMFEDDNGKQRLSDISTNMLQ